MLQQTQANRVADIFESFMRRFPTPATLAGAEEDEVVAAWKGLGYYRRARMLRAAAMVICEQHAGEVPHELDALESLPGVGRYTAGAVASIAFKQRAAIVDGNVSRVIARLDAVDRPGGDPSLLRHAWKRADELVEASNDPALFNEGLMELGASICTPSPRPPRCRECPLRGSCQARKQGLETRIPRARPRAKRRIVHHHAVALRRDERWLLTRRARTGHWAGMWELPSVEDSQVLDTEELQKALPIRTTNLKLVDEFTHLLSHREIRLRIYTARTRQRRGEWCSLEEIEEIAMSSAMRKVIFRTQEFV
jgi:A/G-specific adenine glycosylase